MPEISLSPAEVTVISSALGVILGVITYLHHQLISEKNRQIVRLERQMDEGMLPTLRSIESRLSDLTTEVKEVQRSRGRTS